MDNLFIPLGACTELIEKGHSGNIIWLNKFCAAFHSFASKFKLQLPGLAPKYDLGGSLKIHVETMFLCFTQVVTCITQLERTFKIEEQLGQGAQLQVSRRHFLQRINWCLRRLHASLYQISEESIVGSELNLEDLSFVELLDLSLDKLETYNEIVEDQPEESAEDHSNPAEHHHQLHKEVSQIVRHALAFANVALDGDKKALNSICQTVLDESTVFLRNFDEHTPGDRKLESLSLQRALFSLESYLNEALLRLIFDSLQDVEGNNVTELKNMLRNCENSETIDKLIAEFDITMDRIQQIGVIAIAFTQDVKTKTIVRSCLATFESLDSSIVPSFQLQPQASISALQHADILEHHFKSELVIFRNVIHEIIDSRALISSYLDILSECIPNAQKSHLSEVVGMANVLSQHFQLKVNYQELGEKGQRLHHDFLLILRECKAVLEPALHVDPKRIVKRLKILYSVLSKLRDDLSLHRADVKAAATSVRNITKSTKSNNSFAHRRSINNRTKPTDTSEYESDLISFQLTELLNIN